MQQAQACNRMDSLSVAAPREPKAVTPRKADAEGTINSSRAQETGRPHTRPACWGPKGSQQRSPGRLNEMVHPVGA